jgi:hypothetical protein
LGENEEEEERKRIGRVGVFRAGSRGKGDRARETGFFLHYEVYLSL